MEETHMRNITMGLIGLGIALGSVSPGSAQDIWVKTDNQDCTVHSDEALKDNEAVTWTGSCADGRASGVGVLEILTDRIATGFYEGGMVDGKLHGEGILRLQTENKTGFDRLEGTFVSGEPNGTARFEAANGDYFDGSFKDGERHGTGFYRLVNGEEYYGDFEDGKRSGVGFLIDSESNVYFGQFKDGSANGAGVAENADGSKYQGQFANNLPDGAGTYVAANGDIYQGRFNAAKADGKFLVTKKGGEQSIEIHKNGELVK
jgi:hypothetical protein